MKVMVWYLVSDTNKAMTPLILVVLLQSFLCNCLDIFWWRSFMCMQNRNLLLNGVSLSPCMFLLETWPGLDCLQRVWSLMGWQQSENISMRWLLPTYPDIVRQCGKTADLRKTHINTVSGCEISNFMGVNCTLVLAWNSWYSFVYTVLESLCEKAYGIGGTKPGGSSCYWFCTCTSWRCKWLFSLILPHFFTWPHTWYCIAWKYCTSHERECRLRNWCLLMHKHTLKVWVKWQLCPSYWPILGYVSELWPCFSVQVWSLIWYSGSVIFSVFHDKARCIEADASPYLRSFTFFNSFGCWMLMWDTWWPGVSP